MASRNAPFPRAEDLFGDIGKKVEALRQEQKRLKDIEDSKKVPDYQEEDKVVEEIDSLCMNCREDGTTRLLLTRIPYFREVVIMSFECPHCGFRNSEVQSAGEIQPRGCKYILKVMDAKDLQRQVVKSDTCSFRVEALDLEIPPGRGQLTNVEGILTMIVEDLQLDQPAGKEAAPEVHDKIEEIIGRIKNMLDGREFPFYISIDDPAGNSWIEPSPNDKDAKYVRSEYRRTPQQNEALGLADAGGEVNGAPQEAPADDDDIVPGEVYSFPASCPGCTRPCTTHMKMVNIPFFKDVVLMSTVCDHCGYRSNEVKTGGEVPEKGRRITLTVENKEDLSRDILKSESCALECPELNLTVQPGTMGGRFTTVEGLLTQIRDDLHSQIFDTKDDKIAAGDSMAPEAKRSWEEFFAGLDAAIKGDRKFTVILQDPLASSYVQNNFAPADDPQIKIEDYTRTEEEEEELGLRDMKTENYTEEQQATTETS